MTTIIMISNDSSVIINASDADKTWSESPECSSVTPDASFVTPRPSNRQRYKSSIGSALESDSDELNGSSSSAASTLSSLYSLGLVHVGSLMLTKEEGVAKSNKNSLVTSTPIHGQCGSFDTRRSDRGLVSH